MTDQADDGHPEETKETEAGDTLEVLSERECMDLLATEQVGRLSVIVGLYPQVFPVNYRLDNWIVVFRSHVGTKLGSAHHHNVGFEVDHLDPTTRTGWSVLIQGMAEDIEGHRPDAITERTENLGVESWAGGDKPRFVRIIPAHVTGRRIAAHHLGWPYDNRGYL